MVEEKKEKEGRKEGRSNFTDKKNKSFLRTQLTTHGEEKKRAVLEMDYQNNNNPVTKKSIYSSHQ